MALSLSPTEIVRRGEHPLLGKAAHWERIRLGDVADVQNGFPFKSELFHREVGTPLIRIRDVNNTTTEHRYTGDYDRAFIVRRGDIIVGMDGDFKVARWQGDEALLNQRVCRLTLHSDGLMPAFFFLCLQPYLNAINAETSSITVKHLSSRSVEDIPLPLPPLREQHRIVAKIEELFSELDKAVESLTLARAQLKTYRQSLLKAAFEGKLTADWRAANPDKLEPPEALLARIRAERGVRYEQALADWQTALAEWRAGSGAGRKPRKPVRPSEIQVSSMPRSEGQRGWVIAPLGLVIDEPAYGTSKKCDYETGGSGVLRIPNIGNGTIDTRDLKFASFDDDEREAYRLSPGDLLTIRSNGSISLVGKVALISDVHAQYLYAGYLIRLRPNPVVLEPSYLLRVMESHGLRSQIEFRAKSTSGVNNINSRELQELLIPICCRDEQREVVARLEERLSALEAVESEIDTALAKTNALRQTILKKAFSGQLVRQDPTDEPAAALLARLREQAPPARTYRRRKTA